MIVLLEMFTWVIFCSLKTSCTNLEHTGGSVSLAVTMKTFATYYNPRSAGVEYKDI